VAELRVGRPLLLAVILMVGMLSSSCQRATNVEYETISLDDLRSMAPFDAEVEVIDITETVASGTLVLIGFRNVDGKRIAVSEFPADSALVEFAESLREGDTYRLPRTLLKFEDEGAREVDVTSD
jgi:hypothetical protein